MTMFAATQDKFTEALLDADQPVPPSLRAYNSVSPIRRFAVYRNNVVVGLVEAVRSGFPAVERIVGAEFFGAMARCYVIAHPPRSPLLMNFGDDFADFIDSFEPAAELRYLADIARLEFARRRAYHAADAAAVAPELLAGVPPQALAGTAFMLHPSVHVLRSRYPLATIWRMNSGDTEPAPVDEAAPEDVLVLRAGYDVVVQLLGPGQAVLIDALRSGRPLGDAVEAALVEAPAFDLSAALAMLIGAGAIIDIHVPDQGSMP